MSHCSKQHSTSVYGAPQPRFVIATPAIAARLFTPGIASHGAVLDRLGTLR
jgi:hypothetical protein